MECFRLVSSMLSAGIQYVETFNMNGDFLSNLDVGKHRTIVRLTKYNLHMYVLQPYSVMNKCEDVFFSKRESMLRIEISGTSTVSAFFSIVKVLHSGLSDWTRLAISVAVAFMSTTDQ